MAPFFLLDKTLILTKKEIPMIKTVSDFILGLKNKEIEILKKYGELKHPVLIGSMYEGLTKELLEKTVFDGLDIRICSGKIKNMATNEYSGEIDCMIVTGEGENIPYTDKFIYDSKKVIAVIQVKKNLYLNDIRSSHGNLLSVIKGTEDRILEEYHRDMLRISFQAICQEELPSRENLHLLSKEKQMIYHILLLEACYPIRITLGYNGYKSEHALREGYWEFLDDGKADVTGKPKKGFGALSLPSLVICDNYTLIKGNGMPYGTTLHEDKWWVIYMSSNQNPFYYLLESIWTRLSFMFKIDSSIFGEDLKIDQLHGFIAAKYEETPDLKGWMYFYISMSEEDLSQPLVESDWEPVKINETQHTVILKLGFTDIDYENDKGFLKLIKDAGFELNSFLIELKETGLVHVKNGVIKLLTDCCTCVIYDGNFYAAENSTGRLTRWVENKIKNSKK